MREYAEAVLVCAVAFVFLRGFALLHSEIPSGSMKDTLLPGDYVLVDRTAYAPASFAWERHVLPSRPIARGDVVVFRHPDEPERDFIKRVIGLPGETIELADGVVRVNGVPLVEPWIDPLYRDAAVWGPYRVPPGEYFLLGDHRNDSADSRMWRTTTVPRELVTGRAFLVLFSATPGDTETDPGRVDAGSILRKLRDVLLRPRWDRALRPVR